jgi:hypothetical protein
MRASVQGIQTYLPAMRASVREIPTMRKGPTRDEEGCGWRDAKSVLRCYDDLCVVGAREVIAELYSTVTVIPETRMYICLNFPTLQIHNYFYLDFK